MSNDYRDAISASNFSATLMRAITNYVEIMGHTHIHIYASKVMVLIRLLRTVNSASLFITTNLCMVQLRHEL